MPLTPHIDAFLDSRRIDQGAADKTIEAYRSDLAQWRATLPPQTPLEQIEREHLSHFLSQLHQAGMRASSIARKVSALRQFFKFCCLERGLDHNPAEQIRAPALPRHLPKALTLEQMAALLAAADQGLVDSYLDEPAREALQARDRAMVYLLYASGLRVSELVGLTAHGLDLKLGYVRVRGKGDRERIVPFAPAAGLRLATYLEKFRPTLEPDESETHLFIGRRGSPLTRQAFWNTMKLLGLQAGLPLTISPHVLRHSFATHLLHSGMNLRSLQMLLGHSDLSTTQIYTQVSPEHLKDAHRKFHPRGE